MLNAQNQTWIGLNGIPGGVHHPVTFAIGDYGYSITGTSSFGSETDNVYRYNPKTDTWATMTDFPGGNRGFAIGLAYQGKGYVGFGAAGSQYFKDLWVYDTASMAWTQLASCPGAARRHPALMAANGKIYMGLGNDNTGDLKDFWVYDIATNAWTQLPDIPGPSRHHPFMFAVSGEVYAGMGHGGNFIFGDWYRFDTVNNNWQTMSNFPGENRVAGTQIGHLDHGYVLSGDGDNHSFMSTGEFWEYEPSTDSWSQLSPHPGPSRWAPGSFVIGDTLYFFGGFDRFNQFFPTTMFKYAFNSAGIGLEEFDTPIAFYPNPSEGWINIDNYEDFERIEILSMDGKSVFQGSIESDRMDLGNLELGMYLVRLYRHDGSMQQERLLIK